MTPEQIQAAVEALTPLAEKLGTTVEYIYAVYRAYQWHYAVANLVSPVIVIALVFLAWGIINHWVWRGIHGASDGEDVTWPILVGILGVILIALALMWIGAVAEDSYLRITNPDFYAIQGMLKLVGK